MMFAIKSPISSPIEPNTYASTGESMSHRRSSTESTWWCLQSPSPPPARVPPLTCCPPLARRRLPHGADAIDPFRLGELVVGWLGGMLLAEAVAFAIFIQSATGDVEISTKLRVSLSICQGMELTPDPATCSS
jgi:hypothetical protein